MGFWGDFGGRCEYIWWGKCIRPQNCEFSDIFGPDLTTRVVALYGYSHLPQAKIWASLGVPSSPTRSRRKSPVPEGTPLDLPLSRGKIKIILRCNLQAVGWSLDGKMGFVQGKQAKIRKLNKFDAPQLHNRKSYEKVDLTSETPSPLHYKLE